LPLPVGICNTNWHEPTRPGSLRQVAHIGFWATGWFWGYGADWVKPCEFLGFLVFLLLDVFPFDSALGEISRCVPTLFLGYFKLGLPPAPKQSALLENLQPTQSRGEFPGQSRPAYCFVFKILAPVGKFLKPKALSVTPLDQNSRWESFGQTFAILLLPGVMLPIEPFFQDPGGVCKRPVMKKFSRSQINVDLPKHQATTF
jgi:hypothetical protein